MIEKGGVFILSVEFPSWGEFYRRFKNDPEKARSESFGFGSKLGHTLMMKLNLKGDNPDTLAKVINAFMREVKSETTAKVEDSKVIYRNRSFCQIMVSARSFNQPWLWLDENVAWPFLAGLASAVNPSVKHEVTRARAKGDPVCEHVFKITK